MTLKDRYTMMTEEPVSKIIPRLAVPTIVSMMVTSVYNIADTYFVSQISTDASAAVGVVFSLMAMIQAVGFTLGMGSGNYVSRLLGQKDYDTAKRTVATAFFTALIFGIAFMCVCLGFINPFVTMLGATYEIKADTISYAKYILIASPYMMASFVLNNQLRAQGSSFYSMLGIASGGILNVILDPILIFGFKLGISGAAIATMVSQFVSFLILLILTNKIENVLSVSVKAFRPTAGIYKEIINSGMPSFWRQGLASLSTIVLNNAASGFGSAVIASMSIVNKCMFLIYSVLIGFAQGFQPVCGFNFGAKKYDRVLKGYNFSLYVALGIFTVLGTLMFIFSPQIMRIFRDDEYVISTGVTALRMQCVTLPLQGYIMISQFLLQSIGYGVRASVVSMSRQGLFLVPLYYILPGIIGIFGIQSAQSISDVLTFVITIIITTKVTHDLKRMTE